ncbi:translation termination factor GTPase eRF3, partial [Dispira parvispora]
MDHSSNQPPPPANDAQAVLTDKLSRMGMNPVANEFKPSVKAREFVPSWKRSTDGDQNTGASQPSAAVQESKPVPDAKPSTPASTTTTLTKDANPTPAPVEPAVVASKPTVAEKKVEVETEEFDETLLDENFKEHFNVVFIGHVDAGKSTMGGNILFLTGMVDKRTMEKYEREAKEANRESWYLSWALDTNAEERAKGKTVECGRAYFETAKRRYTVLDAPG